TLTPVTDNGDGTYTAVFSATTPGTATISGNVNSADMIDTVDIEVSVGKANTLTSTVTSGEASITAGESTTITVQLKDAHGNALVTGGDSVELETDLGTVTPVVDNDDGTYTATFSSTASGTATIAGKLNGQEIASFVEVEVLPGPADAEQSIMETSASSITTDDSATITVRLKDAHGNFLTAGGDSVELATDLGTLSPVVDQGDGTYTAAFSATTPGRATSSDDVRGADMIDTVDIEVSVGKANTLTSTVTSGEASITAGESTTITVQLKGAHGNALVTGGDSVELETDLGTVTPVVDNDDGTYTATFSSTASGTAT